MQGEVLDLWAGSLAVATGAEFRRDAINVTHDPLSNLFAYFQNFGADYDGTAKVTEAFVEADLPLARDQRFAKGLSINAAARQTHYELSGFGSFMRTSSSKNINATAWKGSLVWDPTEWVKLRATRSAVPRPKSLWNAPL